MADDASGKDHRTGRFLPGNAGGGRPKGARNKLGEEFLAALQEDFTANGKGVIEKVRAERPHEYLKIVASLMPKELNLRTNPLEDLSDDEIEEGIELLRGLKAAGRLTSH